MIIDQERIDNINIRMSEWLSSQGMFAQLRYSVGGGFLYSLCNVFSRLLLLLLLVAVGGIVFLYLRVGKPQYNDQISADLKGFLGAEELKVRGVGRQNRGLIIYGVSSEGGEESFFENFSAKRVQCGLDLFSGVLSKWEGQGIKAESLDMMIKSGAENDEMASACFDRLLRRSESFNFSTVEVNKTTIRWGYTETTYGRISDSRLKATQGADGSWNLNFKGGTFSQNWLNDIPIKSLTIVIDKDKVEITEGVLEPNGGELSFSAVIQGGGHRPEIKGVGSADHLSLRNCLNEKFLEFFDGSFSGDFEIKGSTNSQTGIGFSWKARLDEGDEITIWNSLPLLKALAIFDQQRSYRKVVFQNGLLNFETGSRQLLVNKVNLDSAETMKVMGEFKAAYPTRKEASERLGFSLNTSEFAQLESIENLVQDEVFTLDQAGKASSGQSIETIAIGSSSNDALYDRTIKMEAMQRELDTARIRGTLNLGLAEDAFSRFEILEESYPLDEKTGKRWLELNLNAPIQELTDKKTDELYDKANKDKQFNRGILEAR